MSTTRKHLLALTALVTLSAVATACPPRSYYTPVYSAPRYTTHVPQYQIQPYHNGFRQQTGFTVTPLGQQPLVQQQQQQFVQPQLNSGNPLPAPQAPLIQQPNLPINPAPAPGPAPAIPPAPPVIGSTAGVPGPAPVNAPVISQAGTPAPAPAFAPSR